MKKHVELLEQLEFSREEVEGLVVEYSNAASSYNYAADDVESFCREIGYQMRKYYDSQSREWRESKEGQELIATAYMWTNFDLETAEDVDEYLALAPEEDEEGEGNYKKFESLPTHREELEEDEEEDVAGRTLN